MTLDAEQAVRHTEQGTVDASQLQEEVAEWSNRGGLASNRGGLASNRGGLANSAQRTNATTLRETPAGKATDKVC